MPVSDCDTHFAALLSLPENLGEVRCCAISRDTHPFLLGSLLGKGEARQLTLCLRPLTNSENVVKDGEETAVKIATNAFHI
jgi:hypothetical protein